MSSSLKDMYISSKLVQLDIDAKNDLEALEQLATVMIREKVVEESFTEAIKEREKEFPTGLSLENIGVAIPHTDSIHVKRQSLAIGILNEPVKFRMMGGDINDWVEVKLLFMLAIKDPHKQVEFLQALVNLMQDDQQIIALLKLSDEATIVQKFEALLNKH